MPTFCRHGRFIERCPICRRDLPGAAPERRGAAAPTRRPRAAGGTRAAAPTGVRVRREQRAEDDGYRSDLAPGLRASADAQRLVDELARAAGVLDGLTAAGPPPGDREQATRACLQAFEPPAQTLEAYDRWAARAGSQAAALIGDPAWDASRRFARAFERLALPDLTRPDRFRFLAVLGAVGLYDLQADALHLLGESDPTELAAKRVLGIGDVINLERRAHALAEAAGVGLDVLDLALARWGGDEVTLGIDEPTADAAVRVRAQAALGLEH